MDEAGLAKHRGEIDRIDREILALLNARCGEVLEIGKLKEEHDAPVYVPERERAILDTLLANNPGPLSGTALCAIYREIMAAGRELERPLKVAYLGPEGTFTHQAAQLKFSHQTLFEPQRTIFDVFSAIECDRVDYGCVPVENSTEGVVTGTLDRLFGSTLKICGEIYLPIHQNLAGGSPPETITRIFSHPQALAQCRNYLQTNFPGVELIETASTASAARQAAEAGAGAAAVCSKVAAETAGLPVIRWNIEDSVNNITRFVVLGKQETAPTGDDKTSLCIAVRDRVGALYDALEPLREGKITMTMIESRPSRVSAFEYWFFVDILGHKKDKEVEQALRAASGVCSFVKVLGSYPRGNDL